MVGRSNFREQGGRWARDLSVRAEYEKLATDLVGDAIRRVRMSKRTIEE